MRSFYFNFTALLAGNRTGCKDPDAPEVARLWRTGTGLSKKPSARNSQRGSHEESFPLVHRADPAGGLERQLGEACTRSMAPCFGGPHERLLLRLDLEICGSHTGGLVELATPLSPFSGAVSGPS